MGRLSRFFPLLALGFLGACTTSTSDSLVLVPPAPRDDAVYAPVLDRWHSYESVVSQFQKKLEVHAVLFTDEFRRAYLERFQRMRGEARSPIEESLAKKIVVFVSVYAPDHAYESLDDRRLWTIGLDYGASKLTNPDIRSLSEKEVLAPFFPFVNPWSRDFLVAFDPGSDGALPQGVTLVLRSALANVSIPWRDSSGNP